MKKRTLIMIASLCILAAVPVAYYFVALPLLNDRANAIMITGSGEEIEAQVKQASAKEKERLDYPIKWDEKTMIVSEETASALTARQLILRKQPANPDKREPLNTLPIRPADAEGVLFAGEEDKDKASAFPLNDSEANLGYGGNYFLGNLRLTESAIIVLPNERYEALTLPEQQLSLLKFGVLDDTSEKVGDFAEGARLVKIDQKKN